MSKRGRDIMVMKKKVSRRFSAGCQKAGFAAVPPGWPSIAMAS
jgi:hypothetical protein